MHSEEYIFIQIVYSHIIIYNILELATRLDYYHKHFKNFEIGFFVTNFFPVVLTVEAEK